jgi:hypothetical protein
MRFTQDQRPFPRLWVLFQWSRTFSAVSDNQLLSTRLREPLRLRQTMGILSHLLLEARNRTLWRAVSLFLLVFRYYPFGQEQEF